jgi:glycolate oxidase FAD binding subunit
LLCRFTALPSRLAGLISDLERTGWLRIIAEPDDGVLRVSWPTAGERSVVKRARAVAMKHAATCVVERCSPDLKRHIDVFGDPPPSFDLMRRVKQQFDPKGILSPGRFVGRL